MSMVKRRKSLRRRDAMSIRTIPSAPNADEMATRFPKVSKAQFRTRCGVQFSAAFAEWSANRGDEIVGWIVHFDFHGRGSWSPALQVWEDSQREMQPAMRIRSQMMENAIS